MYRDERKGGITAERPETYQPATAEKRPNPNVIPAGTQFTTCTKVPTLVAKFAGEG